jgi:hypothetical protein
MFGGLNTARSCPFFKVLFSPEQLKQQFNEEFKRVVDASAKGDPKAQELARTALGRKFPDVAALLWVLGEGEDIEEFSDPPKDDTDGTDL